MKIKIVYYDPIEAASKGGCKFGPRQYYFRFEWDGYAFISRAYETRATAELKAQEFIGRVEKEGFELVTA
jgi:hypothetical protein